ncbi:RCC1 domain-containing protein 1 [Seminavis robusta]|uniref:RCC1 domain-containing protein 1 n=1 Tax=Seminavis robusta TaxID=568900 RepID=A0A9N8EM08_9STRA|nr:RCC1 domain-containing protein 1 [Seminavis robusta]|eukprot:Sro1383_g267950.1 RCC1 domain-containing protein 1 (615) ;mRNA; f:936-3244
MSSPARKRKTDDDGGDSDLGTPNSTGSGASARKIVKRSKSKTRVVNRDFIRLKETLHQMCIAEIMQKMALVDGSQMLPSFDQLPQGSDPVFAPSSLVTLRWELAAVRDMYHRTPGEVIVMGQDDAGQLGMVAWVGKEKDDGFPPTHLKMRANIGQIIQVAAGGLHSAALSQDGAAYTWGCPDEGALGRLIDSDDEKSPVAPTMVNKLFPSKLAVSRHAVRSTENECNDVIAIDAGSSHTTFLTISGNVYTCGMYTNGDGKQVRDERPPDCLIDQDVSDRGSVLGRHNQPVHVFQLPGRAKFIAAGGSTNAAILEDDSLVTWGMGQSGQMARSADMTSLKDEEGHPEIGEKCNMDADGFKQDVLKEHYLKPKRVLWSTLPTIQRTVTHVAIGEHHILVAARSPQDSSSRLYSSGSGAWGILGHGDEQPRHALTLVETLKDVPISRVAAGNKHSLILHAKGDTVYACGHNGFKQCGVWKEAERKPNMENTKDLSQDKKDGMVLTPTAIPFPIFDRLDKLGRIIDIAAGESHSIAITTGGGMYTWGYGEYGQCGKDPKFGVKDIEHPRLAHDWLDYTKVFVHHAAGGGQHSVVVASRYHKSVQRDVEPPPLQAETSS